MSRSWMYPLTIDISSDSDSDSIQADDPLPSLQVIDILSSDDEEGNGLQGERRSEESHRAIKTNLSKSPFPSPLISTNSSASQSPHTGDFKMPASAAAGAHISTHDASDISADKGGYPRNFSGKWYQKSYEERSREDESFGHHDGLTDASEYDEEEHFGVEMMDETVTQNYHPPDTDYEFMAQRYYLESKKRKLLRYQQEEVDRHHATKRWERERPMLRLPPIPPNVLSIIFLESCRFLERGQAVDWATVSRNALEQTGNEIDAARCRKVFEYSIQEFPQTAAPRKPADVVGRMSFLKTKRLRELGPRYSRLYRDRMMMTQIHSYKCATTFDFSSGSVVDFALKANGSGMKLAIANSATNDIYNRPGNLLLCDLEAGVVKRLHGHETQDRAGQPYQNLVTSVNDVKLSYSESFFITGSNDKQTIIWNSDTGERTDTIQHSGSINQVATVVDSMNGEDVFATCSSKGIVDIFSLDSDGKVKARNKRIKKGPAHPRVASCVSFGREYFWDCLAVGLEGLSEGWSASDQHGMIEFYDANTESKKGELEFRRTNQSSIAKSVSCLSFSPDGEYIVCGTSGRSAGMADEMGDGLIRLFDVRRYAKQVQVAESGQGDVNIVDFSPCGQYVISCASSNEIAVFDRRFIATTPLHQFVHQERTDGEAHEGVTSALWLPQGSGTSGSVLLTTGADGAVRTWDLRQATDNALRSTLNVNLGPLARAVASPMYEHLIVGSDMGAVSIFTMNGGFLEKYRSREMVLLSDHM
ncbi:hypothetical protein EMPS_04764 [Entomortierella parvispora]|uniref:WD40 repeat-like protein n=1 Tax=Entomortierella parvispora TaxID=205924 RepID=A0A9P3H9U7_9FUNG|nr:hypothetical protein EMPS_04764 [Entomortierella parvispora]